MLRFIIIIFIIVYLLFIIIVSETVIISSFFFVGRIWFCVMIQSFLTCSLYDFIYDNGNEKLLIKSEISHFYRHIIFKSCYGHVLSLAEIEISAEERDIH